MKEHLGRPDDQSMDVPTKKKMNLQVFIAALLCEHCDFDKLRTDGTGMDLTNIFLQSIDLSQCLQQTLMLSPK